MKFKKLAVALLVVAGSAQAGSGKTFGAVFGGTALGNIVGNAFSRPKVVHVTESSSSRTTNRALKNLQNQFDDFYSDVKKTFKTVAKQIDTMADQIQTLQKRVKKLSK